ncbi:nucleotide exchange factor GrpE [Actinokineospora cianjurensis]|uniref:nucleotide exchange factor GrpE n=1 Tax=Actinokineospora cianjurensis TaxID=585224 RepID=UPI001476F0B2|nr:nucleotide exchange factor GrpE [Actinokineospora cianjurensis]
MEQVDADTAGVRDDAAEGRGGDAGADLGVLLAIQADVAKLVAETGALHGLVDRLHRENEALRRGESLRVFDPVIRDLIKLTDDWRRRGAALRSQSGPAAAVLCDEVAEDAEMILDRLGVTRYAPDRGEQFDRREHHATGTEPTEDPALDSTVAEVKAPGYRLDDRAIRYAQVVVHRVGTA